MWLIPGKTKIRLEIFKGVTLVDILLGLLGVASIVLVFLSNLSDKVLIASVIFILFAILLIRVDEDPVYFLALNIFKYIICNKHFQKSEGKLPHSVHNMEELAAFSDIREDRIVYGKDYFGAVLEIPAVEFRLFSENRKNMAITGGLGSVLRSMNPLLGMNIVKLERPVHYEGHRENELKKLDSLRRAYEYGLMTEEELQDRVEIVYNRIEELDRLVSDEKVIVPFYYLVFYDSDERRLESEIHAAAVTLGSAEMNPRRLNSKELAVFLKYSNESSFDESEIDSLSEEEYARWAMPAEVHIQSNRVEIDHIVTHEHRIVNYPAMVNDAWLATVMTIPGTKVVVKCTAMDLGKAIKNIDKSLFELRSQYNATGVESRAIELGTHIESLSNLLVMLKGENETLLNTNVYITSYDVVTSEKLGRIQPEEHTELPRISDMKRTVRRTYSEQGFRVSSAMFSQFQYYVGSQISAYDPLVNDSRSVPGNSLAACFPWVFARIEDEKGVKLGSTDQVPVFVDFFKRNADRVNSNLMIVGKSGSGKSYAAKSILANLAADNVKTFVLDPENEYTELAENLHGKFINVANAQYGRINPFQIITSMDDEEEENHGSTGSYATHLQFLEEFFRQIMPDCEKDALEYLNTIVDHMYLEQGINGETSLVKLSPGDYPTFDDLYDAVLREFQRTDSDYVRSMLRPLMNYVSKFASGGRNANIWNGPSTITTEENFTVFNFQTILANRNPTVSNAQMLLVLKYIDNEIIKNREFNQRFGTNRKIAVVIDEAHVFIDEKYPVALDFMFQLAKRIRKYNGMQIVITQNIKDFVGSEEIARKAGAIINASQYSLIFSLAPNDLSDLCNLYEKAGGINEIEQETIGMAPRGLAFSVLSPMQRTTFQIESSPEIVDYFKNGNHESAFFQGEGGEENWQDFLGDSKEKRAQNLEEYETVPSEENTENNNSFVSFEEFSETESKHYLRMLEEEKTSSEVSFREESIEDSSSLPDAFLDREASVKAPSEETSVRLQEAENAREERLMMMKLLESMSAENLNLKIREQISEILLAKKEQEAENAPEVRQEQEAEKLMRAQEALKEQEEQEAEKLRQAQEEAAEEKMQKTPLARIIPEKIPAEQEETAEETDSVNSVEKDPFGNLFDPEDEKSQDLFDIMKMINAEAEKLSEISAIEQMPLYQEKVIDITLADLAKYVRNLSAK